MNKIEIRIPIYTHKGADNVSRGLARLCRSEMCPIGTFDCPFTEEGRMILEVCHNIASKDWKKVIETKTP